jgi:hypothetical protein
MPYVFYHTILHKSMLSPLNPDSFTIISSYDFGIASVKYTVADDTIIRTSFPVADIITDDDGTYFFSAGPVSGLDDKAVKDDIVLPSGTEHPDQIR